jgi:hypothetical protein
MTIIVSDRGIAVEVPPLLITIVHAADKRGYQFLAGRGTIRVPCEDPLGGRADGGEACLRFMKTMFALVEDCPNPIMVDHMLRTLSGRR